MRRFRVLMTSLPLLVIIFLMSSFMPVSEHSEVVHSRVRSPLITRTSYIKSDTSDECDEVVSEEPEELPVEAYEGKELYIYFIGDIQQTYFPGLDPFIVQAVLETESNYIPTVQSSCGAVGLMQVIPKWHAWRMDKYGLTDIWDPYTNILVGMDFLNESLERYGNYYQALLAYNNSSSYANYVLNRAEQLRQGGE